jgi:LytS/YehU family sensor histidine kinase
VQGSFYLKLLLLKTDPDFVLTDNNRRIIFFGMMPFIIASIIFRLISDRIRMERLQKEAKAERLASELKYLRSQVSPHFLFNTMTNLVSLARQQSTLLEPSLIKLSDLLRYMLYDSSRDKIAVSDELEQMKNYLSLQQLRFGDEVDIEAIMPDTDKGLFIEPMLLIPFVENAFKHGIALLEKPFISIKIEIVEQKLIFIVRNNYNSENRSKDKDSGIGLANVRNRLELLYPGKHLLSITEEDNIFTAQLNLNLHDELYRS